MSRKIYHKPNTPSDISRNSNMPELILSSTGKNKSGQYNGYIVINFPLQSELEPTHYLNIAFIECDGKLNLALGCSDSFESEGYKLTDLETTVRNNELFNEISECFGLDFEKSATYHFYDITFDCDSYGNIFALVNMDKYYSSPYILMPYSVELQDEWSDIYELPSE